jgi:predicted nucleic acid-binding protein
VGPEHFYVECGAVFRRWDLNRILTPAQIGQAIDELLAWPLRVTQVRALFGDAWRLRANVTFADALYVALAEHLGADLLSDDGLLATRPVYRFGSCTAPSVGGSASRPAVSLALIA